MLVDDGEMAEPYLKHIVKEKRLIENSVGRFLYDFFELLIEMCIRDSFLTNPKSDIDAETLLGTSSGKITRVSVAMEETSSGEEYRMSTRCV